MLDINKIEKEDLAELARNVLKISEVSELQKYYLFTNDINEKAKVFILCYKLLDSAYKLADIKADKCKQEIEEVLKKLKPFYIEVHVCLDKIKNSLSKRIYERKLFDILLKNQEIDDLITLFSVLTEREMVIKTDEAKGIIMEGKSEEAYKKVFNEYKKIE